MLLLQHFLVLEKLKNVSLIVCKGIMFPIQIHIFSKFKIFQSATYILTRNFFRSQVIIVTIFWKLFSKYNRIYHKKLSILLHRMNTMFLFHIDLISEIYDTISCRPRDFPSVTLKLHCSGLCQVFRNVKIIVLDENTMDITLNNFEVYLKSLHD